MLVPDRRRRLLDQIRRDGSAQVEQLSTALRVSRSTVRRDLASLEADGLVRRARGGAVMDQGRRPAWRPHADADPAVAAAKRRIGQAAVARVEDGMTIMVLSGTTTAEMLPHLAHRSVTVVTNGLDVAHTLADYPDVSLVVLGGVLHREQRILLGPMTEQNMADLHVDVMFAGAWGVHPGTGVTGAKIIQAGHHHAMLQHVGTLVVLADGSKFGRRGPTLLARSEQVGAYVTDGSADEQVLDELRAGGADVLVC